MDLKKEGMKTLKLTLGENEVLTFKGLDKKGNCYFKFDALAKDGSLFKLRVPKEVGYEMVLLMRDQLIKFIKNERAVYLLDSNEKYEFNKLKEALCDNKSLEEFMNLRTSLRYNEQFFSKYADKINDIELRQEEALIESINNERYIQKQKFLLLKNEKEQKELVNDG